MGYYASTSEMSVVIPKENVAEALERINSSELLGAYPHDDLCDALGQEFYFEAELSPGGDVFLIYYMGEKFYGDTGNVFWVIRDLIEPGGFINWVGEDQEMWQWRFDNGTMYEEAGTVTFTATYDEYRPGAW